MTVCWQRLDSFGREHCPGSHCRADAPTQLPRWMTSDRYLPNEVKATFGLRLIKHQIFRFELIISDELLGRLAFVNQIVIKRTSTFLLVIRQR